MFGLEENSGWLGHNGMIPGYFTFEGLQPGARRDHRDRDEQRQKSQRRTGNQRLAPRHQQNPVS
jgi:hypothetical protein